MRVVDANVLLYAVNEDAEQHERSRGWLDSALAGHEAVGFPWLSLLAFLRLSTRGLFPTPLSPDRAAGIVGLWLAQPPAVILAPGAQHLALVTALLRDAGTAGNLVNDAHLAALALEHGATVVSFDRDFGRFEGVRWELPAAT